MVDQISYERAEDAGIKNSGTHPQVYGIVKRAFDMAVVVMFAPLVLVTVGILAVLVRRDGGSAFYRQPRVGMGGRTFMLWKLRTMVPDADQKLEEHLAADPRARDEWAELQKLTQDPRITSLGAHLRKYSLDELPQMLNVFLGDMSLVGPRPIMPEQMRHYKGTAYFGLRPGLTGLWQISGRNDCSFEERARMDTAYANSISFRTDMWILSRTPLVVVKGTGV